MAETYTDKDRRNLLIATSSACIITPLMSTMMNLSLLGIGHDFGVGSHSLAYVNTLFILGSVVSMVPSAKYGSIKGMKRVFVTGLILMSVLCFAASFSPNFMFLLSMRFLIGLAAAMLMVTSMAMLTFVYPASQRGRILGIHTTFVYLGLSLGPTIGGALSDYLGWRSIFIFICILSLISLAIMTTFKKEIVPSPEDRMDWGGAALWGVMIITLMFGLINITELWGKGLVIIGAVMLVSTWYYLRNHEYPVLNTRMFRNRVFTRASIAAFMNYGASYSITFFLALYLQSIGELTASQAGLLMLCQPIMQTLLSLKMGALSDRMKDKRILPALGMAITGAGVAMYLLLGTAFSMPLVIVIMLVTGIGLGMFSPPNTSLIISSVEPHLKGEASGVVAVVRQTGMVLSMSVTMSVISIIMGSTDNLNPSTYGSFIDVIHITFSICLLMCIIGAVCSLIKVKEHTE